jgi:hypothetical protein
MRELDLVPTGGRWGFNFKAKNKTKRLVASSITAIHEQGDGTQIINQSLARTKRSFYGIQLTQTKQPFGSHP